MKKKYLKRVIRIHRRPHNIKKAGKIRIYTIRRVKTIIVREKLLPSQQYINRFTCLTFFHDIIIFQPVPIKMYRAR